MKTLLAKIIGVRFSAQKIRIVLVARDEGDWLEELGEGNPQVERILGARLRIRTLKPLMPIEDERTNRFDDACAQFADIRSIETPNIKRPDLASDHFAHPLFIQMAALASVDGRTISDEKELLHQTVKHEQRYWDRAILDLGLDRVEKKATRRIVNQAMTIITLWGGVATRQDAPILLTRISAPGIRYELLGYILDLLEGFYRDESAHWMIRGLEPDLLGEQLVSDVLRADEDVLRVAFEKSDTGQKRNGLTILTRLARYRPEERKWLEIVLGPKRLSDLAELSVEVAKETGDPIGQVLAAALGESSDVELAEQIMNLCPKRTVALREVSAMATRLVLNRRKKEWKQPTEEQRAKIARLSNALGVDLSSLGYREEALAAAQEAVQIRRELAKNQPEAFLPDLATSLNNLGSDLNSIGRREEALAAAQEAVQIRRELAKKQSDTFLPDLALSLNNLSCDLNSLGRHEEALSAAQEAVEIRRELAKKQSDTFLPDLAFSLNNLGVSYNSLGRCEEALTVTEEAVEIRRELAKNQSDTFLPDLALSLNNIGVSYNSLGRREEALTAIEEAVQIRRELAKNRPNAFLPDLAMSLNNLGVALNSLGRGEEALASTEEAVELYCELTQNRPDTFSPNLASALNNLGLIQRSLA